MGVFGVVVSYINHGELVYRRERYLRGISLCRPNYNRIMEKLRFYNWLII